MNLNSIQEEINRKLMLENACYHLVQNLLSPFVISKYIQNYNFASCFV